jgi:sulfoxide reductase heme-binding subunit YedZ
VNGAVLWYLNRSSGIVALVLMTAVLVLGVVVRRQGRVPGLPRFVLVGLHRNVSLLSALFLAVHVVTAVSDSYVDIGVAAAVVPFASTWRPAEVALGALAVDLLVLIVVTSLLRSRLPVRLWRYVHRTSYLLWPLAFLHAVSAGSDVRSGWALVVTLACAGIVGGTAVVGVLMRPRRAVDRAPAAVSATTAALSRDSRLVVFRNG